MYTLVPSVLKRSVNWWQPSSEGDGHTLRGLDEYVPAMNVCANHSLDRQGCGD